MISKECNFCGIEYIASIDNFHVSKTGKFGLSGKCKDCYRKYRELNKEKLAEKNKRCRENNREHYIQISKNWGINNKERVKENSKNYYDSNKEKILYYQRGYILLNKETVRKWRTENGESIRMYSQIRRARKKLLPATLTVEQWENCKSHFDNKCAYCGLENNLVQEHFIPLLNGGEYTINNIVPSCSSCNSKKKTRNFFEWYPTFKHHTNKREKKILNYLGYISTIQQISLI